MKAKQRYFGIFNKVFLYTMLILLLVIGGMFLFFSNQIKSTVTVTQQRQTLEVFMPLLEQLKDKPTDEIIAFAEDFHRKNTSFSFCFITKDGEVLYQTEDFALQDDTGGFSRVTMKFPDNAVDSNFFVSLGKSGENRVLFLTSNENGLRLYVASTFSGTSVYTDILQRAAWFFPLMLLASLLAAFFFARRIAKPIQKVSDDTHSMSLLLPVDPPGERNDEIGKLSRDVYTMYGRLKSTILQLETEVENVKRMEENQRYFFSAASHELKTPIAAISAIIEGILSEVVAPEEYPAYLRECMRLISEQNRLVSGILDLVKLTGDIPVPDKEPVILRKCVDDTLATIAPQFESKGHLVILDVSDKLTCKLNAGLFSTALLNVLLNAAQNSPNDSEIRIVADEYGELIRLTVWNSGAEIPEEKLSKLCEPFFRADEARTTGNGRNGLGLAIVKKSLELMDVDFCIENADGGVLFQMNIPK